jgi:cobalt-zinc-cadmium efflux system outer membrane protein
LRRRVHSAFATGLFQENAYQTQRELAEDAGKLVSIVKARVEAGDAIPQDLARVELDAERAKMELERAAAARERALIVIAAAIGDPHLSVESLSGSLEQTWEIPALNELVQDLRTHPALLATSTAVESSRARLDLSKSQRIPDIRLDLLYRRLEGEKRNAFDVGFSIPVPLFDRNQGRLREAQAELAAAEARVRASENELTSRLREAYAVLTAALNSSQAFKSNIVPRTEIVLKTAQERYALGDISLSELLLTRRESSAVKLTRLELLRSVMEAWGELRSLVNRLVTDPLYRGGTGTGG